MDKATQLAQKQRDNLASKKIDNSKARPEKLTHAEVQALIASANAKKLIDASERKMREIISLVEQKASALEGDVKKLKKSKENQK